MRSPTGPLRKSPPDGSSAQWPPCTPTMYRADHQALRGYEPEYRIGPYNPAPNSGAMNPARGDMDARGVGRIGHRRTRDDRGHPRRRQRTDLRLRALPESATVRSALVHYARNEEPLRIFRAYATHYAHTARGGYLPLEGTCYSRSSASPMWGPVHRFRRWGAIARFRRPSTGP
jgi:hypothetical protein